MDSAKFVSMEKIVKDVYLCMSCAGNTLIDFQELHIGIVSYQRIILKHMDIDARSFVTNVTSSSNTMIPPL